MKLTLLEFEDFLREEEMDNYQIFDYVTFRQEEESNASLIINQIGKELKNMSYVSTKRLFRLFINSKRFDDCYNLLNQEHIKVIIEEENLINEVDQSKASFRYSKDFLLTFVLGFCNLEDFKRFYIRNYTENGELKDSGFLRYIKDKDFMEIDFDYNLNPSIEMILNIDYDIKERSIEGTLFYHIITTWMKKNKEHVIEKIKGLNLTEKFFIIELFGKVFSDEEMNDLVLNLLKKWEEDLKDSDPIFQLHAIKFICMLDLDGLDRSSSFVSSINSISLENIDAENTKIIKDIVSNYNLKVMVKNNKYSSFYRNIRLPKEFINNELFLKEKDKQKSSCYESLGLEKSASVEEIKKALRLMPMKYLSSLFNAFDKDEWCKLIIEFPSFRTFVSIGKSTPDNTELAWDIISHKIYLSDEQLKMTKEDFDILLLNYKY